MSSALLSQARRLFRMQSRLRSNEPVQIAGLRRGRRGDRRPGWRACGSWSSSSTASASTWRLAGRSGAGFGVDPQRILIVPVIGGLVIGVAALIMRRIRPKEVVDPIEANALHGGIMSMTDSLRLLIATVTSNAVGASVGMEAGYSQLGSASWPRSANTSACAATTSASSSAPARRRPIAAAFNAPFAGAFYGYELILGNYSVRALAPVAAAALAGTLRRTRADRSRPDLQRRAVLPFQSQDLLSIRAARRLRRGLQRARHAIGDLGGKGPAQAADAAMAAAGDRWRAAVGHRGTPDRRCWAAATARSSSCSTATWGCISSCCCCSPSWLPRRFSLGSGFRGGMFSASLFLGCLFGGAFAGILAIVVPGVADLQYALMMVGMGAVASAIIGAAAHDGVPGAGRHRQLRDDGRGDDRRGHRLDHRAAHFRLLVLDLALPPARPQHQESSTTSAGWPISRWAG